LNAVLRSVKRRIIAAIGAGETDQREEK